MLAGEVRSIQCQGNLGRYVSLSIPNRGSFLHVCEVEVLTGEANRCLTPLGVQIRPDVAPDIADALLSASSSRADCLPASGRLNANGDPLGMLPSFPIPPQP